MICSHLLPGRLPTEPRESQLGREVGHSKTAFPAVEGPPMALETGRAAFQSSSAVGQLHDLRQQT